MREPGMGIWDEREVNWATGDGRRALELFERAYADRVAAEEVARKVGLAWPNDAPTMSLTQLWLVLLDSAARDDRMLDLAAELLADKGRATFVVKLHSLLGDRVGYANAVRVARYGFPESTDQTDALVESLDLASTVDLLIPRSGELQSINAPGVGIQGINEIIRVYLDGRNRVGVIRRELAPIGTGFLVAHDCLLTAAHVLRSDGVPVAADIEDLDVVFDYYESRRTGAETGTRVLVADLLGASPATAEELAGTFNTWDAPPNRLDYALLRLARRAGDDPTPDTTTRGWYRLDTMQPDLSRAGLVNVFHFPLGSFMSWTQVEGQFSFRPSGPKTRMRYRTNTLPGSSGAPLVDQRGRLLGMHNYGFASQNQNQAIPIWLVAEAVLPLLTVDAPGAAAGAAQQPSVAPTIQRRPAEVLQVGAKPLVNRDPLRDKVWDAMTAQDTAQSLVIVGESETGISWSYLLVAYIAAQATVINELRSVAPGGIEAIMIDLRADIAKSGAERRVSLIRQVSGRLSRQISEEWVAQVARQVSDFKEWCYQQLVGSQRHWWVFIDSIDQISDVERHGVDEVLAALVDLADDPQTTLRLVLAGRNADKLSHPAVKWAARDTPVGLSRPEVRTWLGARATQRGLVANPVLVEAFLDRWFGASTTAAKPLELALALPDAVREVSA
jgi:V8-like Glu-specific endopeptidase